MQRFRTPTGASGATLGPEALFLVTFLFGLWHVDYISSIAFRVSSGLATVMIWKVITGLPFGVVPGAVRLKTRNCYSTMLLHDLMNLLAGENDRQVKLRGVAADGRT